MARSLSTVTAYPKAMRHDRSSTIYNVAPQRESVENICLSLCALAVIVTFISRVIKYARCIVEIESSRVLRV